MKGVESASSSSLMVMAAELWRQSMDWGWGRAWATAVALLFILAWHYTRRCFFVFPFHRLNGSSANSPLSQSGNAQIRSTVLSCFLKLSLSFLDSLSLDHNVPLIANAGKLNLHLCFALITW